MARQRLASLVVDLQLQTAELRKSVDEATKNIDKIGRSADQAAAKLTSFGQVGKVFVGLFAFDKIFEGMAELGRFIADGTRALAEEEKAAGRLTSAFDLLGVKGEVLTPLFQEQADALEELTLVDGEIVNQMQQLMLQMGAAPSSIDGLTRAVLDYSAATGQDALSATRTLLTAVASGKDEISKMGIEFDATGELTRDLATAAEQLSDRFGGSAQAATAGLAGELGRLQKATDDVGKALGQMVAQTGALTVFRETLEGIAYALSEAHAAQSAMNARTDEQVAAQQEVIQHRARLAELEKEQAASSEWYAKTFNTAIERERKWLAAAEARLAAARKAQEEASNAATEQEAARRKELEAADEAAKKAAAAKKAEEERAKARERWAKEQQKFAEEQARALERLIELTRKLNREMVGGSGLGQIGRLGGDSSNAAGMAAAMAALAAEMNAPTASLPGWDARAGAGVAAGMFGEGLLGGSALGSIANGAAQGAMLGGPVGAAAGGAAALLMESEQFAELMGMLNELLDAAADGLGNLLEPLLPLIRVVTDFQSAMWDVLDLIGDVLAPLFNGLAEAMRWLYTGILTVVNFLTGHGGESFEDAMETMRGTVKGAGKGLVDLAAAAQDATEEILNAPQGYKALALARYGAADADTVGGSGPDTAPGADTGGGGKGGPKEIILRPQVDIRVNGNLRRFLDVEAASINYERKGSSIAPRQLYDF